MCFVLRLVRIKSSFKYIIFLGKRLLVVEYMGGINFFLGVGVVVFLVVGIEELIFIVFDCCLVVVGVDLGREEKMGEVMRV